MPFKLKLKKSRQYSVASKLLFVLSVEILDGTNVECTLSSESTGQDCLDIVCQKLSLNQPKFFGLQYLGRNSESNLYWLELDKAIKKQLDKHARNLCVYLRVMYYIVSGVRLLDDEVTRYHYFLQLKLDVIEGKISCTSQQAIELASYSMQAEFGNFDSERHTAHYLKDFQLFPKSFTDPNLLDSLTEAASRQHAALQYLPPGTAEEYYICACQQLEGYGQEIFTVKHRLGHEAVISVSLIGVYVGYGGEKPNKHFGWADIKNVINHKRDFIIETIDGNKVGFHFDDVESAKNAWRFCVLQHTFYRQNEVSSEPEKFSPCFQQQSVEERLREMDSCEDVSAFNNHWEHSSSSPQNLKQRAQSTSCLNLNKPSANLEHLKNLLPSYRPAPDYETAVQNKYKGSAGAISSQEPLKTARVLYSSQPEIHQNDAYASRLQYPDVTLGNAKLDAKNVMSALYNAGYPPSDNVRDLQSVYKQPPPYAHNRINFNSTPDLAGISQQPKFQSLFTNGMVTGSSPDLVSGANLCMRQYNQYLRPHAPDPVSVHRSHSYLAPQQHDTYQNLSALCKSNMLPSQALIVGNPDITKHIKKLYDEHGNIIYCMPANMKQILESQSAGFVVTRNQNVITPHDASVNDSAEPIYENIPLPWQNQNQNSDEMRSRAQSVHSAPDITEVINYSVVNKLESQLQNFTIHEPTPTFQANINGVAGKEAAGAVFVSPAVVPPPQAPKLKTTLSTSTLLSDNNNSIMDATIASSASMESANSRKKADSSYDVSSSSSNSKSGNKKKRWGILTGINKSSDKVKSATLGREKEKKSKNVGNNRHRWSTGLPRFNHLPPSISKEAMCQLLENKLADSQLFFEFDKIPKKRQNADFTTACHKNNERYNLFKDVLPYEENRIRLTPSKDNKFGYINASHITASVGIKQRFYIAAQGPTRQTLPYFWQCVWEAEVYLIVQLTDPSEELNYMPDAKERCIDVDKDYQVWWEFSQNSDNCVTSKVRLCHTASRRYRTLWHMHYTDWNDQGCPHSVAHFLSFLEEMQSVQQHSLNEIPAGHNKNPPILVHCTAGVGRTGLTILSDLLLYTVDHNQEVCIPQVVELLRHQRAYMIQTMAQYRFAYTLLIHYLKRTRLI